LITGSTDGLGRLVARRAREAGAHVLLHGRDRQRGKALLSKLGGRPAGNAFYQADLASLAKVRKLAAAVLKDHDRIHVLVNNAGIGTASPDRKRQLSADGHELRFAVNYLSGLLLTYLLLPAIRRAAPARIVNVASLGQQALDFDDVMLERGYDGPRAYRQSKLAQIMFTIDLACELRGTGVTVNCLHPATFMDTTMVRESGTKPISTVDQGAMAVLNLAAGDAVSDMSGLFFDGLKQARANEQAYDAEARARLRALSLKLTGLS
jgi:NAD(P)-dependent dehydrogenase (short-subunit alcohol dehydrogenase family)